MTRRDPGGVQIDRIHTGAICWEVGERLGAALTGDPSRLPPHILGLMERFESVDRSRAAFKASMGDAK